MRPRRSAAVVLALVPWLLFMSAEEGAKTSAAMDFLGKTVNFLILFGGLAVALRKPLAAMLAKWMANIRETLRLAEASLSTAEGKREASTARLSGLEDEIGRMMSTAESVAQREKDRIAAQAEEEAQRLRRFTDQAIEQQVRSGVRELKARAAETATALARERIRNKLTAEDQAALIDKSIDRLSRLHEG
ncbi:MAG TPA: ATP synthase F0 subunit B [Terriglobales bacterium]|nr:ATP synthase F0 subunit B [Terriglobales bacterium]